ncbi:MAG: FAD-dependent oxidoreductase [Motilibacteraceae bacterium]
MTSCTPSDLRPRVVVVGNGMAGARVVEELRAHDPGHLLSVTVLGEEEHGAYNRILLSEVLAGRHRAEDIRLGTAGWHDVHDVELRLGHRVTGIDRQVRQVVVDDGTRVPYDVLVLATGSRPVLPPLDGLVQDGGLVTGAYAFRTLDDCGRVLAGLAERPVRRAVVLGGGLLGLEAARGLAGRGIDVVVVHAVGHLMERQLDPAAGGVLRRTLRGLGVSVRLGATSTGVLRGPDGRFAGVRLDDGSVVLADLLVVACGVRPETGVAAQAGLAVDRGVVVDDTLRSVTDPRVFALGECAQHDGQVYGLVAPAWEQAAVVAAQVTGADPGRRYPGSRTVTRLKAAGVDLAAMGESTADTETLLDQPGVEVVQLSDPARGTYGKLVVRDGRLTGAILVGAPSAVPAVTQLYDRGAPLPPDRASLLLGPRRHSPAEATESPERMPLATTVCRCNGVTKLRIQDAVLDGARTTQDVALATRATTGCGGCRSAVDGIVGWLLAAGAAEPEPAEAPLAALTGRTS